MAIISVEEMFDTQRSAGINDQYIRTYERVFIVITDGTDGPIGFRPRSACRTWWPMTGRWWSG